ncbi:MAG: hypothetical protein IPL61_02175 [Myxococcales bacterium]|nr:hypothetical protein [Myxococcales bacterium]
MTARPDVLDGAALGHWVELVLPEPPWKRAVPFVGFVYMDWEAGMSAKGGPADRPDDPPSLTVRLPIGAPSRILTADEVAASGRPTAPPWVEHFGPQPPTDAPWRRDPALAGRWHKQFPDDLQVLVHDGEPRRTQRPPEGCWVRVDAVVPAPARPSASADGAPIARGAAIYVGALLSEPRALTSVAQGARIHVVPDPGGRHPLAVTEAYLAERAAWTITPCPRCGLGEGLDPPSVMAATRFPDAAAPPIMFTAHCPLCGPPAALTLARGDGA